MDLQQMIRIRSFNTERRRRLIKGKELDDVLARYVRLACLTKCGTGP